MAEVTYESPKIMVLGYVTDMTHGKPGKYFDFPGSADGTTKPAPPIGPGTYS